MKLSNSAIDKIGDIVRSGYSDDTVYNNTIKTLNDWREAHGVVLDRFYDKCVNLVDKIDG